MYWSIFFIIQRDVFLM